MKKKALITGASSGIGFATAVLLAEHGYDLLLLGRDQNRLDEIRKQTLKCGVHSSTVSTDISQPNFIHHINDRDLEGINLLINNAGVYNMKPFSETTHGDWLLDFQTNFFSAVQLTLRLWPVLKDQPSSSIVNIASTLGTTPMKGTAIYSSSKAAMINWTLNLAQEGGHHNIRANVICPGLIDTPIHQFHNLIPEEKNKVTENIKNMQLVPHVGQPEDIARAILYLDQSPFMTGAQINIDGGINLK